MMSLALLALFAMVILLAAAKHVPLSRDERNHLMQEAFHRTNQMFLLRCGSVLLTYTHCNETMIKLRRWYCNEHGELTRTVDLRICQHCYHIEEHPRNDRLARYLEDGLLAMFFLVAAAIAMIVSIVEAVPKHRRAFVLGTEMGIIFGIGLGVGVLTAPRTGGWVAAILGVIMLLHWSLRYAEELLSGLHMAGTYAPHVGGICFGITWLGVTLARNGVGLSITIVAMVLVGLAALCKAKLATLLGMWLAIMLPAGLLATLFRDDVSIFTLLAGFAGIFVLPLLYKSYGMQLKAQAATAHMVRA